MAGDAKGLADCILNKNVFQFGAVTVSTISPEIDPTKCFTNICKSHSVYFTSVLPKI
jgi:hypothetical protein